MTPDELREAAAVMLAAADGAEIECKWWKDDDKEWSPSREPKWDWKHFRYRVKPPQSKPVERWCIQLVHDAGHELGFWTYETKAQMNKVMSSAWPPGTVFHDCRIRVFQMREVCE